MNGFVYIIKDSHGKFYIGSTSNPKQRMYQHKTGHTQTTRNMENPLPVLIQKYDSIEIARKVERKIKKLKRKDYIEKMIADGYIKIEV